MDTHALYEYDENLHSSYKLICGIDEAGRGPLCGPVAVGAVILNPQKELPQGINDSKRLSAKRRESLYEQIIENALAWQVELVPMPVIDHINISQATLFGMQKAAQKLNMQPNLIVIDGNKSPLFPFYPDAQVKTIVKGDTKSASIAAASILAKVTRDRYMIELDKKFPQYKLSQHKGYPTKLHYELLKEYGINDIYRRSFLKKWYF